MLDGRTLRDGEVVYRFRQVGAVVTADFAGGAVVAGRLVGTLDAALTWSTAEVGAAGRSGVDPVVVLADGRLRVGALVEVDGPRWVRTRVAHPTASLAAARVFYDELLGLTETGGFTGHDGYDGAFFALPGGGELELTTGGPAPVAASADDLLVLYLPTDEDVRTTARWLRLAGVQQVASENPYWDACGVTVLDPDGRRVVLAVTPSAAP